MTSQAHPTSLDERLNCMRCGLCLAVCPTYQETGLETLGPRGRVALVRGVEEGKLSLSLHLARYLYSCLGCLACTLVCPSGVEINDLLTQGKRQVSEARKAPLLRRILLESLLPYPQRMRYSLLPLLFYQRVGLQFLVRPVLRALSEYGADLDYLLPPLPLKPLRGDLEEVLPAQGRRKYRVGLFLGCAQDLVIPSISQATIRVLTHNACEVVVPKNLRCCGMPHYAYGEIEQARRLARHNLDLFASLGVEAVIADCATCGSFTKGYGALLENDTQYAEKAQDFNSRVQDVSEFLAHRIGIEEAPGFLEGRVTYHEACHLGRGQGLGQEPRLLLGSIPGLEVVEMKEAAWCCGGGGTLAFTHYGLSMKVLDRKMANIAATGADLVATGCPACRLQLRLGIRRAGLRAQVVHPIELVAQTYSRGNF